MYERLENETWYRVFDSVDDLVETISKVPDGRREHVHSQVIKRDDFVGRWFSDWNDAYAAARSGWPEGVEAVERMVAELDAGDLPRPANRRRKMRFSEDDGDELDYDRLRCGQPFWRSTRRQNTRGPQTVTIVIDVNANCKVDHEDILWRGAAAIAMTKILEEAGFRVELWTIHCARKVYSNGQGHCNAVCLKRPGDPLDIATFTAAVSGWFYRSSMFLAKAIGNYKPKMGLGKPHAPWARDIEQVVHDPNAILISGAYSYGGALWLAQRALKKLAGIKDPPPPPPTEPTEPVAPAKPVAPPTKKQLAEWRREWKRREKDNVEIG